MSNRVDPSFVENGICEKRILNIKDRLCDISECVKNDEGRPDCDKCIFDAPPKEFAKYLIDHIRRSYPNIDD